MTELIMTQDIHAVISAKLDVYEMILWMETFKKII